MTRDLHRWSVFATLLVSLAGAALAADPADMRLRKKLIATGWDHPDSEGLLAHLAEMEKQPFDGVVIELMGHTAEGKPCPLRPAFCRDVWQPAWFQKNIDQLRACKCKRFTDNFICIGANPGDVDWFDDAGWRQVVEHWRIAAWIAKQSGCKGLLFDPEPYTAPHMQFGYAAQAGHKQHSFNEYAAKARQRGPEIMQAVVNEYPNITLFCYFMNSVSATATGRADPRQALATQGYGLYPAMVDGWLDAAPPGVVLVDGCESAYLFNSRQQFLEAALQMKGACQELVSPENRAKYRAQVQASFGIYLDAYQMPKGSMWYIDGHGGPRVERLRINTADALAAADEYVWIYGEQYRWWPTTNGSVHRETWPEVLPGCDGALRYARDPLDFARNELARLKQSGRPANLTRNGDFRLAAVKADDGREDKWHDGRTPAGWSAWQKEGSHGTLTWDRSAGAAGPGAAKVSGVASGCLIQTHKAAPGERYAVRAAYKVHGNGNAWLRVRWQTPEGHWTAETQDKLIYGPTSSDRWQQLFGVVEVPEHVGRLVILLSVEDQSTADDVTLFDDVELYKLP
jgi:hypothetical protein